eukprot:CAMPEP_0168803944 /NCGR_PEP_ID=MMETSP0726-20121227/260_1 /TAXON_ID=265536 /ORGANISM="Amphiprora sp., Strain CCMP467" /LENGTH=147 /DNA_ID=CAMNT_0008855771 /DNA_START=96 /DNA_END=539 /DNA_ORIENTATION=+
MTFGNSDLGTCLDYTRDEANNRQPNFDDYDFLYQLYGLVPGAEPYNPPTAAPTDPPTTSVASTSAPSPMSAEGPSRSLRSIQQTTKGDEEISEEWMEQDIDSLIDRTSGKILQPERWRVLHSDEGFREAHHADLGGGRFFQVHRLLA